MTLVALGLAWFSGAGASALWGVPAWMSGGITLLLAPLAWARNGRYGAWVTVACVVAAIVGGLRFDAWANSPLPPLADYTGSTVVLEGRIDSEPSPGRTVTRYVVDVERVGPSRDDLREVSGKAVVTLDQFARHLPGTRVRLEGELEEAPQADAFDYRGYLARRGIVAAMFYPAMDVTGPAARWDVRRLSVELRLKLDRALARSLPEPEASLASGILIGFDGNLPDDLYGDFRDTGLAHIVAVSGTNVSLVTAIVFALCTPWLGRKAAIWPAGVMAIAYVLAAGASASVVRAGIMAGVFLFGAYLGRQRSGLAALAAATVAMNAVQPGLVLEVGFQLSVAATAGLIAFAPWIEAGIVTGLRRIRSGFVPRSIVQVAALTLAATFATLPISWHTFGRVSLIGPVANIVVEPLFAIAFVMSGLTAVGGVASDQAGWLCGLLAFYPLAAMCKTAELLAMLPGASIAVPAISGEVAVLAFSMLAFAAWPAVHRYAPDPAPESHTPRELLARRALATGLTATAGTVVLLTTFLPMRGPGQVEVRFLDAGQGDAVLVTTPSGEQVLIDGGPSGIGLARQLGETLPHWERTIDAVFVTHPQQDHIAGVAAALDRYRARHVFDNGAANSTIAFATYARRAGDRTSLRGGERLEIDGVVFEVLWPPAGPAPSELNDSSLVLRMTYGNVVFLFTGDIEAAAQATLMAETSVRADVLKVPHHGSKTSSPGFLRAVGASVAVISVGEDNQFGHPHAETLAALEGSMVLRTDVDGRVTIETDGAGIVVRITK